MVATLLTCHCGKASKDAKKIFERPAYGSGTFPAMCVLFVFWFEL